MAPCRCPGSAAGGLDLAAGAGLPGRERTWVYEEYGVKQAHEWLGHSDPATTLHHYVRLTTAAQAKAMAGLDEVTRAALDAGEHGPRVGRRAMTRARSWSQLEWAASTASANPAIEVNVQSGVTGAGGSGVAPQPGLA